MPRLTLDAPGRAAQVVDDLCRDMNRRIAAMPAGLCPVDVALNFLTLCRAQTCGKCAPCRVGLAQLENLMRSVLTPHAADDGSDAASPVTVDLIEQTAAVIADSADCAIGAAAASIVLQSVRGFRADYEKHLQGACIATHAAPVPCVAACPAHVDIPGYIALTNARRYDDALALIRRDNPFPASCGYVCEHPCELRCRRRMVDDAVNICGIKRFAHDHASSADKAAPACAPATGKRVAIVGGGPGGLTCAYYLSLMGHKVTVFEQRETLGGMLRYGIPDYRLPPAVLNSDIDHICSTGIEVRLDTRIGRDVSIPDLERDYDAVFVSIGAHSDRKLGIEGEGSKNVLSAVEFLRACGAHKAPDFTGRRVVVVGGGNVSMDATRTAKRLGASSVTCVYRRRVDDMTAQAEEIADAQAEGCRILTLHAPARIEANETGEVAALWAQPQIIGPVSRGRPAPRAAAAEEVRIPCDYLVIAIGQSIDSADFATAGIPVNRGTLKADATGRVPGTANVFAGGDDVTGPATVIRAVAAGKVAAANIDSFLGFNHAIRCDVEIPAPHLSATPPCGRVQIKSRNPLEACHDFELASSGMSEEEVSQETSRCLRCDRFGYGSFREGRTPQW